MFFVKNTNIIFRVEYNIFGGKMLFLKSPPGGGLFSDRDGEEGGFPWSKAAQNDCEIFYRILKGL